MKEHEHCSSRLNEKNYISFKLTYCVRSSKKDIDRAVIWGGKSHFKNSHDEAIWFAMSDGLQNPQTVCEKKLSQSSEDLKNKSVNLRNTVPWSDCARIIKLIDICEIIKMIIKRFANKWFGLFNYTWGNWKWPKVKFHKKWGKGTDHSMLLEKRAWKTLGGRYDLTDMLFPARCQGNKTLIDGGLLRQFNAFNVPTSWCYSLCIVFL